ncbi:protein kinase domain-containing protein [Nocardia aurantia]|uniref:non-specific serine/threonine protein kinase n=1 Tax=Nocardia aurantia TaxID=2585199 RepID=A0A7K0DVT8_9NOCA|nr:protein kinase [Nocardia aurantia]MQY29617.1 Serine/threonine-protein kinase PknD [Nocardia aurantia]
MNAPRSRAGTQFGPYELRSLLGRGTVGEVYEAYDTEQDRVVALKLLSAELTHDLAYRQRFLQESRKAAQLGHPHIVPINGVGEMNHVLYVDMLLVRPGSLRALLQREAPLDPVRAVNIVYQVATALDTAHAAGLVHRDVKPSNILVTATDDVYLTDFGVAGTDGETGNARGATALNSYLYMAPEGFDAGPVSGHADTYALAGILHECLTGTTPFPARSRSELIRAHLSEPPPRASLQRREIPAAVDAVIAHAMEKKPTDRYGSTGEFAGAARAAVGLPGQPLDVDDDVVSQQLSESAAPEANQPATSEQSSLPAPPRLAPLPGADSPPGEIIPPQKLFNPSTTYLPSSWGRAAVEQTSFQPFGPTGPTIPAQFRARGQKGKRTGQSESGPGTGRYPSIGTGQPVGPGTGQYPATGTGPGTAQHPAGTVAGQTSAGPGSAGGPGTGSFAGGAAGGSDTSGRNPGTPGTRNGVGGSAAADPGRSPDAGNGAFTTGSQVGRSGTGQYPVTSGGEQPDAGRTPGGFPPGTGRHPTATGTGQFPMPGTPGAGPFPATPGAMGTGRFPTAGTPGAGQSPGTPGQAGRPNTGQFPAAPGQAGGAHSGPSPTTPGQAGRPHTGQFPAAAGQPGGPNAGQSPTTAGQPGRPNAGQSPTTAGQPGRPNAGQSPTTSGQPGRPNAGQSPTTSKQSGRPNAGQPPSTAGQPGRPSTGQFPLVPGAGQPTGAGPKSGQFPIIGQGGAGGRTPGGPRAGQDPKRPEESQDSAAAANPAAGQPDSRPVSDPQSRSYTTTGTLRIIPPSDPDAETNTGNDLPVIRPTDPTSVRPGESQFTPLPPLPQRKGGADPSAQSPGAASTGGFGRAAGDQPVSDVPRYGSAAESGSNAAGVGGSGFTAPGAEPIDRGGYQPTAGNSAADRPFDLGVAAGGGYAAGDEPSGAAGWRSADESAGPYSRGTGGDTGDRGSAPGYGTGASSPQYPGEGSSGIPGDRGSAPAYRTGASSPQYPGGGSGGIPGDRVVAPGYRTGADSPQFPGEGAGDYPGRDAGAYPRSGVGDHSGGGTGDYPGREAGSYPSRTGDHPDDYSGSRAGDYPDSYSGSRAGDHPDDYPSSRTGGYSGSDAGDYLSGTGDYPGRGAGDYSGSGAGDYPGSGDHPVRGAGGYARGDAYPGAGGERPGYPPARRPGEDDGGYDPATAYAPQANRPENEQPAPDHSATEYIPHPGLDRYSLEADDGEPHGYGLLSGYDHDLGYPAADSGYDPATEYVPQSGEYGSYQEEYDDYYGYGDEYGDYEQPRKKRSAVTAVVLFALGLALAAVVGVVAWHLLDVSGSSRTPAADTAAPTSAVDPGTGGPSTSGGTSAKSTTSASGAPASLPSTATVCSNSSGSGAQGKFTKAATGSTATTCAFAEAVRKAYAQAAAGSSSPATISATSPVTGRSYTMNCTAKGELVTCTGGENAVVYVY